MGGWAFEEWSEDGDSDDRVEVVVKRDTSSRNWCLWRVNWYCFCCLGIFFESKENKI